MRVKALEKKKENLSMESLGGDSIPCFRSKQNKNCTFNWFFRKEAVFTKKWKLIQNHFDLCNTVSMLKILRCDCHIFHMA